MKVQQQGEYRNILNDQKVTRGLGLQPIAGDPPAIGQARIRATGSPSSQVKAYASQGMHNSNNPGSGYEMNNMNNMNNYSMPQMSGMAPNVAGGRRAPHY